MKERISILLLVVLPTLLFSQCPDVLPTGDFSMNFCNFPFAWEVTRGEHVVVGIFDYEINDSTAWSKRIKKLAPASTLQHHSMCDFLNKTLNLLSSIFSNKGTNDLRSLSEDNHPVRINSFLGNLFTMSKNVIYNHNYTVQAIVNIL